MIWHNDVFCYSWYLLQKTLNHLTGFGKVHLWADVVIGPYNGA